MDGYGLFAEHLEQHNPFGIKDAKGKILFFNTYRENYLYVLKEMRSYCKRGFVDVAVLLHHLSGFDEATCIEIETTGMKLFRILRNTPILIDWEKPDRYYEVTAAIMKSYHIVTDTQFDGTLYELAWNDFKKEPWQEKELE